MSAPTFEAERQRVAEACANVADEIGSITAGIVAESIRAGQWREHLK